MLTHLIQYYLRGLMSLSHGYSSEMKIEFFQLVLSVRLSREPDEEYKMQSSDERKYIRNASRFGKHPPPFFRGE